MTMRRVEGGPDLRGCVNDAKDVAHTLNALGIVPATPKTMCILTDQRATRLAILDNLKWLVKQPCLESTIIFAMSPFSLVTDHRV